MKTRRTFPIVLGLVLCHVLKAYCAPLPAGAAAELDLYANKAAITPQPEVSAPSHLVITSVEDKTKDASRDEVKDTARTFVQKALRSEYVKSDTDLYSSYSAILTALTKSNIKIKRSACTGYRESFAAYVEGGEDALRIYYCKAYSFLPAGALAQTLVHELSHLLLHTEEQQATRLETIAAYLGGRTPELNGYNSDDFMEEIVSLDEALLRGRGLDYFSLMRVRTPELFRKLKLRTYAIYKNSKGVGYMLNRICGNDEACTHQATAEKDEFGLSALDLLAQSGVNDPPAFIRAATR